MSTWPRKSCDFGPLDTGLSRKGTQLCELVPMDNVQARWKIIQPFMRAAPTE